MGSFLILSALVVAAEDVGALRIEVAHLSRDCEDHPRTRCVDQEHYRFVVDKETVPDWKALDAWLRAAAEGDAKHEGSGRRVLIRPEERAPYAVVWRLLESCSKAGLHRFVWTATALKGEKPTKGPAPGRSPSDLWIRIEFRVVGFMTQVEDGPWISEDREFLEALRAAGIDGDTTAIIDPEAWVPWSEVARRIDFCAQSGMEKVEFLGLPAFPPGYSNQVTEEEAAALARALDEAAAEDQPALLDHLVDRHEMFRRMMGTAPLSIPARHVIASVLVPAIPTGRTFASVPGSPRALRLIGMNPPPLRPLFRVRTEKVLNYIELVLARRWDGQVRVVDLFNLSQGGLQSEEGAILLPNPPALKIINELRAPMALDLYMGEDDAFWHMVDLLQKNAHREVDEYFFEKKDAFKTNKKAHRHHLGSAAQIDSDAFLRAVREMKECFPNDPSLLLFELQGALAKQDLKGTLQATDALERRVKKDPHLDIIRARAHLVAGDPAAARPFAAKAIEGEPDFAGGWWLLVEVCLAQKDFKAAAETLSKIEEKLELEIGDLESSPPYAEFVKSKEYRVWSEARRR